MNKTELINSLSEETMFSKRDIMRVLDAFVRITARELKKGNRLQCRASEHLVFLNVLLV